MVSSSRHPFRYGKLISSELSLAGLYMRYSWLYAVLVFGLAAPLTPLSAQSIPGNADLVSLKPGDLLRLTVWREPDLSGEFLVEQSGEVTLPLIGPVAAVGVGAAALVDDIESRLREEIRNPSITLVPLYQVYLLGDVARPGLYHIPPATNLAGAVAAAGGANAIGDIGKLSVYREGEMIYQNVSMEEAISVIDLRSGDQIYVGRIAWVKRNVPYLIGLGFTVLGFVMQFLP